MPTEERPTKDSRRIDDVTVPETDEATLRRIHQAEESASAFESAVPTRKSLLPETLAKAVEDEATPLEEGDLIVDEDPAVRV